MEWFSYISICNIKFIEEYTVIEESLTILRTLSLPGNSFINTVVPLKGGYILFTETSGEIALLKSDK